MNNTIRNSAWALGLVLCFPAAASDPPAETFYEQTVKPIFADHCYRCHSHSAPKIKGGLVLDSLGGLLQGGNSGPAIVPGKPEESLLLKAVSYEDNELQMPPQGKMLTAGQIAALTQWVKLGAPWPGTTPGKLKARGKFSDVDRAWWAFQPVREPKIPEVKDEGWSRNPIDQFIYGKLQQADLKPRPEADRRTLLRRLFLDLWGLPPTPEDVRAFLSDASPQAYEKWVDRLLESPRYGERGARFWLDLVRFAESDGYKADGFRPQAWRYRDYVIKSLNDDKPYDRFVREQLAGDEQAPDDPEAIDGTMFLRHWIYEYNNPDVKGQIETILNELTDVTGDVFMGMGMSCARCHDHKFDPILQKDYYRLQAFFAPLLPRDDLVAADAQVKSEYRRQLARWESLTADIRAQIAEMESAYKNKNFTLAAKKMPDDIQEILLKPAAARSPYEEQIWQLAYKQVGPAFDQLETKLKGAEKEKLVALQQQLAKFDAFKPKPLPLAVTVTDVGPKAPPVFIPKSRNREEILPGFLTLLHEQPAEIERVATAPNSTGRRTALARWITRSDNPLTTRVIVNRIWQQHFGRGLVATASDFGRLGQPPTHPELLDWLTLRFIQDGWRFKALHRLIVMSATYRQAAVGPPDTMALKKDPENLWLWRMNFRRLDADQLRDSMLAVSDELNYALGGPSVEGAIPRRSIYTKVRRNVHDPLLAAFDAPDNIVSTPQRNVTTTATQALLMFNSKGVAQRARALTERVLMARPATIQEMVAAACRFTLGREPSAAEVGEFVAFVKAQAERIKQDRPNLKLIPFLAAALSERDGKSFILDANGLKNRSDIPDTTDLFAPDVAGGTTVPPKEHPHNIPPLSNDLQPADTQDIDPIQAALTDLCHVLLNSNEFLYVD